MSYEFGFARAKNLKKDGPISIIFESAEHEVLDEPKDVLRMNQAGYSLLNQITERKFFEFIKGDGYNQRYMRLKPQQHLLEELKKYIPAVEIDLPETIATHFKNFIPQCEEMIKKYDEEAVLLIY